MKTRIFTDGACSGNPGPGGWAAIILLPNDRQQITGFEEETTNNRMELKAAVESLKLALSLGQKKVDIYSDSAYVVNAVKNKWLKKWGENGWKTVSREDVKNKDLWLQLVNLLEKSRDINFIKIKGHSGDKHNEAVDKLAKREIELARVEAW
ncbi:MAG: ribonuclease HI [Clostridia bacterium]|nr:ribonuclease HI [Clostridia bacterium]